MCAGTGWDLQAWGGKELPYLNRNLEIWEVKENTFMFVPLQEKNIYIYCEKNVSEIA